jgi:hypothetical protein
MGHPPARRKLLDLARGSRLLRCELRRNEGKQKRRKKKIEFSFS